MVDAQEWLDKWYPRKGKHKLEKGKWKNPNENYDKKRKEITSLDISQKRLAGSLDLTDFINLEELDCSYNSLTNLILNNNCGKLKRIYCQDNQLTSLNISNQLVLTFLNCSQNKSLTALIVTNKPQLTTLVCSNCNLINLQLTNNHRLKLLNCSGNSNLTFGLEYLPKSLETFYCLRTKLVEELATYGRSSSSNYLDLLQFWRQSYPKLVQNTQQIMELENTLTNLSLIRINPFRTSQSTQKFLPVFIFQTEEQTKELKKKNESYYQAKIFQFPKSS